MHFMISTSSFKHHVDEEFFESMTIIILDPLIAYVSSGAIDLLLSISLSMNRATALLLNSETMWLRTFLQTSALWKFGKTWCFQLGGKEDQGANIEEAIVLFS